MTIKARQDYITEFGWVTEPRTRVLKFWVPKDHKLFRDRTQWIRQHNKKFVYEGKEYRGIEDLMTRHPTGAEYRRHEVAENYEFKLYVKGSVITPNGYVLSAVSQRAKDWDNAAEQLQELLNQYVLVMEDPQGNEQARKRFIPQGISFRLMRNRLIHLVARFRKGDMLAYKLAWELAFSNGQRGVKCFNRVLSLITK